MNELKGSQQQTVGGREHCGLERVTRYPEGERQPIQPNDVLEKKGLLEPEPVHLGRFAETHQVAYPGDRKVNVLCRNVKRPKRLHCEGLLFLRCRHGAGSMAQISSLSPWTSGGITKATTLPLIPSTSSHFSSTGPASLSTRSGWPDAADHEPRLRLLDAAKKRKAFGSRHNASPQ